MLHTDIFLHCVGRNPLRGRTALPTIDPHPVLVVLVEWPLVGVEHPQLVLTVGLLYGEPDAGAGPVGADVSTAHVHHVQAGTESQRERYRAWAARCPS
jgi:hypothetical protein